MPKRVLIISIAIILCFMFASTAFAQPPDKTATTDPSKKPVKVRSEPDKALKDFLLDVPYIITPEEEKAFKLLKTAEEREKFIDDFWNRRNPNPDSQENEYREQYYERIAYANEHFSSGIPGWKTDRGRIYVTWASPTISNRILREAPMTRRRTKAVGPRLPTLSNVGFTDISTAWVMA
jgi:GWxTD domain-containing protein